MLTGPEQLQWRSAITKAFSPDEFRNLVFHRLDERVQDYADEAKPYPFVVDQVIDAFSRRDWEDRLIARAVEARPSNGALVALAQGQRAVAEPSIQPQRFVQQSNSLLNIGTWLAKAGERQVRVCRIEIVAKDGYSHGTGFLIQTDLVMTNYHVMEPVIAEEDNDQAYRGLRAKAADVRCRFDHKVLASGLINVGTAFPLARDWRVATSPNSPKGAEPTADQLDFAIIRLAEPVASLPVGDRPAAPGDQRGFIALPDQTFHPTLEPHLPLLIIQHPKGAPMKLAMDLDAIQEVNKGGTRVRYRTNTDEGSSGSPCFDRDWNLIALHHGGDPSITPQYNEGIPIEAIVGNLAGRGLLAAIHAGT